VHVGAGTHTIANNLTCGHHTDRNVCQAYDVSGGSATLRGNRLDHCKFGIRTVGEVSTGSRNADLRGADIVRNARSDDRCIRAVQDRRTEWR